MCARTGPYREGWCRGSAAAPAAPGPLAASSPDTGIWCSPLWETNNSYNTRYCLYPSINGRFHGTLTAWQTAESAASSGTGNIMKSTFHCSLIVQLFIMLNVINTTSSEQWNSPSLTYLSAKLSKFHESGPWSLKPVLSRHVCFHTKGHILLYLHHFFKL